MAEGFGDEDGDVPEDYEDEGDDYPDATAGDEGECDEAEGEHDA